MLALLLRGRHDLAEHLPRAFGPVDIERWLPLVLVAGALLGLFRHFDAALSSRLVEVGDDRDAVLRALLPAAADVPVAGEGLVAGEERALALALDADGQRRLGDHALGGGQRLFRGQREISR